MRKRATLAGFLTCLGVLAGCSNHEPSRALDLDDVTASAPSSMASPQAPTSEPAPSTSATPVRIDQSGHSAVPGRLSVGPEREAVAQAWLAYWRVRVDAFYAAELDPAALGVVATDDAADQVVSYVGHLQQNDLHTVGAVALTGTLWSAPAHADAGAETGAAQCGGGYCLNVSYSGSAAPNGGGPRGYVSSVPPLCHYELHLCATTSSRGTRTRPTRGSRTCTTPRTTAG